MELIDEAVINNVISLAYAVIALLAVMIISALYKNIKDKDQELIDTDLENNKPPRRNTAREIPYAPIQGYNTSNRITEQAINLIARQCPDAAKEALLYADKFIAEYCTDKRVQDARTFINLENIEHGKKILNEVLESCRNSQPGLISFVLLSRTEKEKLRNANAQYAMAYIYMGALSWANKEFDSALALYEQATKLNRKNADAWHRAGQLQEQTGDKQTAAFYYMKAKTISEHKQKVKLRHIAKANLEYVYNSRDETKKKLGDYKSPIEQ